MISFAGGGKLLKSITLRGLDEPLAETLKQEAKGEGKSLNQFILDILKERMGLQKGKRFTAVHHDMDHFPKRWSRSLCFCVNFFFFCMPTFCLIISKTNWFTLFFSFLATCFSFEDTEESIPRIVIAFMVTPLLL